MASVRPFAIVRTVDQWRRCAHVGTALDAEARWIEIATLDASEAAEHPLPSPGPAGGLAFDRACRVYHSVPAQGRLESVLWKAQDPLQPAVERGTPEDLLPARGPVQVGDFTEAAEVAGPLSSPGGIAVGAGDRLYVAEAGRNRILVFDLVSRRPPLVLRLADESEPGPRPLALAASGERVYALTASPARVLSVGRSGVVGERPLPSDAVAPTRIAVGPNGRVAVLDPAAQRVWFLDGTPFVAVPPHATDLAFESAGVLVIALRPGEDFRRVAVSGGAPTHTRLKAREYDGLGIARTPDGRIAFWTVNDRLRHAVAARAVYRSSGTVTTFRLDSGEWQTTWGRLFLDVCLPAGTDVQVFCAALDEPLDGPTLPWTPPVNAPLVLPDHPELTPPLPSLQLQPQDAATAADFRSVHRRETGRELPWAPLAPDRFVTVEAPVLADPGRYLWVTLKLIGNTRVTPRVICLRAEYPSHDYLRRLPRVFSADPDMASFLRRYLAPLEGALSETDARGFQRRALLNPQATPEAALPWLASFLGLVLDERWARAPRPGGQRIDVRRRLIAEANCLFRFRGTVAGLSRLLEIYTGVRVELLEQFRVRGTGGGLLGARGSLQASAVVGTGLRVGGALGDADGSPLAGSAEDAFRTHAHRFSVIVPALLDDEAMDVVRHLLEVHRPAHTIFEICTVGAGMRVGIGLHVALSSFVGEASGFHAARVGDFSLGRGAVLGRPEGGMAVGISGLDAETRIA